MNKNQKQIIGLGFLGILLTLLINVGLFLGALYAIKWFFF